MNDKLIKSIIVTIAIATVLVTTTATAAGNSCSIHIQTNPGNGAYVYIYDDTISEWVESGSNTEPLDVDVVCGHDYTVWVEKGDHTYAVQNAHGWSVNPEGDEASGQASARVQNIHFDGKVIVANNPPVADANGPYEACAGESITFDGSGSYDPDPYDTLEYRWDFDSDGNYDTGWSSSPTHTWLVPYTGIVTLEVRDLYGGVLCGGTDTDTATVTVVESCVATAPDFSICQGTTVDDLLFIGHGASCSAGCTVSLDYSFDGNTPGPYTYTVTCEGDCGGDTDTGTVTVVESCVATAPDFSICHF
jgi:hypothetical protein